MTVWIVMQSYEDDNGCPRHMSQGVFSSEELAIAACRDEHYWIGPVVLDEQLPHDKVQWDGAYYPRHPDETRGRGYVGEIQ